MIASFELSKLAKELGFTGTKNVPRNPILRYNYYTHDGILNGCVSDYLKEYGKFGRGDDNKFDEYDVVTAPSYYELQDWLREEHDIFFLIVSVYSNETVGKLKGFGFEAYFKKYNKCVYYDSADYLSSDWFETYERGLTETLNLIKYDHYNT